MNTVVQDSSGRRWKRHEPGGTMTPEGYAGRLVWTPVKTPR
jgi:hypothetical protein